MKRFEQWLDKYGVLMKTDEVARELRMHPTHIRNLCASGQLPAVKVGARWLIDTERLIVQLENG